MFFDERRYHGGFRELSSHSLINGVNHETVGAVLESHKVTKIRRSDIVVDFKRV